MTTPTPDAEATLRMDSSRGTLRQVHRTQFEPGAIIAARYRIAGILGSGGMGEVYRADDTKLGQTVALKFLPPARAAEQHSLERLHDEVRLGRQVAHPNVCRIYDIGEWEGGHFVTMEYVDGEDLAKLLHRIGRLAHDKAVEIARGIAAGLAAAHAKGILHRDLKPANVMIDSHGDARITDFGLALAPEEGEQLDVAGTPAYMAPEQLEGGVATIQSDLYSLGCVLYEVFTGRRVHAGKTLPELRNEISSADVTTPSSVVKDIDPVVERVILRCLQSDPAQRPRSARQVVESLPGGDPLAAALAAGETPSPRLVAAAGTEGSLSPVQAWSWLGLVLALCVYMTYAARPSSLLRHAHVDKPPDVMRERAAAVAASLGLPEQPHTAFGFETNQRYVAWLTNATPAEAARRAGAGPTILFWVRQSPKTLTPSDSVVATPADPPLSEPGTWRVQLDPRGHLVGLLAVPPPAASHPPDWNKLLAAAGLDARALKPAPATFVPPVFATERMAWTGVHPNDPKTPIRVEAAAVNGVPAFLRIGGPWDDDQSLVREQPFSNPALSLFLTIVGTLIVIAALLLAWYNLRARRGDRAGAQRLGLAVFAIVLLADFLFADHHLDFGHELTIAVWALKDALFDGVRFAIVYLALEPYARRKWPDRMISWARMLAGNVRDPLVGRHVLIGIAGGLAHAALATTSHWLPVKLGAARGLFTQAAYGNLLGVRFPIAHVLASASIGLTQSLLSMMVLVVLTLLLRRRPAAAVAYVLIHITGLILAWRDPAVIPFTVTIAIVVTMVMLRAGILSLAVTQATFVATFAYPLVTDWSAWHAPLGVATLVVIAAVAVWAFRTALAGQNPFPARLLED